MVTSVGTLPDIASPKRRERVMHGVTNRLRNSPSPRRLCQAPNPKALVEESFMKNFDDQRSLMASIRSSNMTYAPEHHSYSVPPPLPMHQDIWRSMKNLPREGKHVSPAVPPSGIPGLLGQTGCESFVPRTPRDVIAFAASPRAATGGDVSPRVSRRSQATLPGSADSPVKQTAAQIFMSGDKMSRPTALKLPPSIVVHVRAGYHTHPDTLPLTQPMRGTGSYADHDSRFDANTRGLNICRVTQEEKLRDRVMHEAKIEVTRQKTSAVIASRTADGERTVRIDEGRIRSKALQRSQYQERMSKYTH